MNKMLLITAVSLFFGNKSIAQKEEFVSIEKKIDSLVQTYHLPSGPGIAVSVVKSGKKVYSQQTGYANLEYDIPINESSIFLIASVSKQFTAFAALLLEDEGKLSFDDDIKKYLPELNHLPYKVSVRQLANHTHGFANTYELSRLLGTDLQDAMSHQEIVALLFRQSQLNFVPGSQFQYNNSGYVLLAEIVQRVSGKPFATFLKERIFVPLKMNHTLVCDDLTTPMKNKVYSYRKTETSFEWIPLNNSQFGSTGVYTTTHDLSLWAMNFDNPIIGKQEILKKMATPSYLNSGEQIPYGLGEETKNYKGLEVIFHGGGDAGYRVYLLRVPEHQFSVIVMGNIESFNPLKLSYEILDLYMAKYQIQPEKKVIPNYTNNDLKKWTGDYEIFPGNFFSLVAQKDSLYFKGFQSKDLLPLPTLAENQFSFPYIPHSKFTFSEKGCYWHFSDFKYSCKKVTIAPPNPDKINALEFAGIYYNEELRTSYILTVKNNKLVATHSLNQDIDLNVLGKDGFYSDQSFFGALQFIRNKKNEIVGYKLSGQNLSNIFFRKMK
jgi:CubicO group peptidase (beta-lactamase class C family)